MTVRRIVYVWTGYWSFDREYLKDEPLDPPNILVNTTLTVLGLLGLGRVFQRDCSLGMRFAIVLVFFPLTYYVSHPETYYFRPVDPLIVVLAAVAVAGSKREPPATHGKPKALNLGGKTGATKESGVAGAFKRV